MALPPSVDVTTEGMRPSVQMMISFVRSMSVRPAK